MVGVKKPIRRLLGHCCVEDLPHGQGYVASLPTRGPLLSLSTAWKRWGPHTRFGLRIQSAPLWATSDFVPRSAA